MEIVPRNKKKYKVAIVGFPSLGIGGNVLVEFIADNLKAKEEDHLLFSSLPQFCAFLRKRITAPIRTYVLPKKRVFLLVSDVIVPSGNFYHVSKEIVRYLKIKGVESVLSFADSRISTDDILYAVGKLPKFLKGEGRRERLLEYGGLSGFSGSLMLRCVAEEMPCVTILANTKTSFDVSIMRAVLRDVDDMFKLGLNLEEFVEQFKIARKEITEVILSQTKEVSGEVGNIYG